jgi:putative inorganic carbon (HCO3(-)) transporter
METVTELTVRSETWWRPDPPPVRAESLYPGSDIAFWGLVAFTVILLLSPQTWFPALKVVRIAFLAAGIAGVVHVLEATALRRPIVLPSAESAIALALLTWSVLTTPYSVWVGGSFKLLTDQYIKVFVFFWLIGSLVTTRERLRAVAWALALCAIPLAGVAVQHYLSGDFLNTGTSNVKRIAGYTGLSGNPNDLALTLNLIIPIAGVLLVTSRSLGARLAAGATLLLAVPAVILTFSRAGFLTLGAIVLLSLVYLARRRAAGIALVVVVLGCAAIPFLPAGYMDRLNTITDMDADKTGSAQGRWKDFQVAVQVVAEHPVLGVGLGQDILALNEARGKATWRSVHNAYLEYAVDLGLPGLLLFLALLVASFRSTQAVARHTAGRPELSDLGTFAVGIQIALVAFAVAAFFHPIAYQFYFFCVAGLAVAVKNACRAEAKAALVRVEAR